VRRCFRILNAKSIGLTITLADIAEEEFRLLESIEAERHQQMKKWGWRHSEFSVAVNIEFWRLVQLVRRHGT
jgi:hypothetical protein